MRFSVIIPLYNKAPYITKALESVASQTWRDFEIVVVDDGSTDGSADIAKKVLAGSGCEYHLLRQPNAGVSTARNNGVAASGGEYICFLDADDWWAPTFLERMDSLIGEYPDAGIYGSNYYYVKNGRQRICVPNAETGYINYCRVYAETLAMPLTSISVCMPRCIFDEFSGFRPQLKLGEDFDLWIKIVLRHKVAFLNEALAYYNQDANPQWRGTGHLVNPGAHMLWNLDYLEGEEKTNPDYKQLIDNLRSYSLLPYYLSSQYRKDAKRELKKVDWSRQPAKTAALYKKPIWFLKSRRAFLKAGSNVKQMILRHI